MRVTNEKLSNSPEPIMLGIIEFSLLYQKVGLTT